MLSGLNLGNLRTLNKRAVAHALVIGLLSVALLVIPDVFESPYIQDAQRVRGQVVSADNSRVMQFGIVKTGTQDLQVKVLDGPLAGREVNAVNLLSGKMEVDEFFSQGDIVLLVVNADGDQVVAASASDHYRLGIEIVLFLVFGVLLLGFAGWTGLKALLSFTFAVLLIWKALVPGILLGWDPILLSLLLVSLITVVTMSLVAGLTRVAVVAALGSLTGIILTCGLAVLVSPSFHLSGAVMPFAETLLYSGFPNLDIGHLLLAGVFIGASGAVMDLAIDVSTAMHEVVRKCPDISRRELILSGFSVGRAMTSTLITTLLMAYTAGSLALLAAFVGKGIPPINILNTNYVAAEILRTVVGSLGLVAVAPLTAVVGGMVYMKQKTSKVSQVGDTPARDIAMFRIDASVCNLRIGDAVGPDTVVGRDYLTGELIKAGRQGQVTEIGFNGGQHVLTVIVRAHALERECGGVPR